MKGQASATGTGVKGMGGDMESRDNSIHTWDRQTAKIREDFSGDGADG
jgi:hypothetical protein